MNEEIKLTVIGADNSSLYTKGYDYDSLVQKKYPVPILGENGERRLIINPDVNKIIEIANKICENHGLCPSKLSESSPNRLMSDTRCPCPDLIIYGKCECGLFIETDLVPIIKKEESE